MQNAKLWSRFYHPLTSSLPPQSRSSEEANLINLKIKRQVTSKLVVTCLIFISLKVGISSQLTLREKIIYRQKCARDHNSAIQCTVRCHHSLVSPERGDVKTNFCFDREVILHSAFFCLPFRLFAYSLPIFLSPLSVPPRARQCPRQLLPWGKSRCLCG